ncbi:hypothetical protein BXZ70DRAFT_937798 [Cristinia sonorae]|uniref:Copper acquisition factor BIM1-like domain-containing protein n=1 Tax=Cristinia sonorae TaxID=1940300 RepID=A0A8K0UPE6_9AGAR|nr:hypothetical protein BXZ70DRAFT_937798 [Cristinia sonorae]
MRFTSAAFLSGLLTVVSAHFQLQFPPPRGPFIEKQEPNFCDSYTSVVNRTQFPLSGGFISLNSEHPKWTFGVIVSTSQNPTSFNDFSQAVNFTGEAGEGAFCLPVDLSASMSGLTDGQNITIQAVYDGGDGQLYQCSDLTLSSSFTIPSDVACKNATSTGGNSTTDGGNSTTSNTTTPSGGGSSAPPSPSTTPSSAETQAIVGITGLVAFAGAIAALF